MNVSRRSKSVNSERGTDDMTKHEIERRLNDVEEAAPRPLGPIETIEYGIYLDESTGPTLPPEEYFDEPVTVVGADWYQLALKIQQKHQDDETRD